MGEMLRLMQTPDLYCDECGAANLSNATICFACQQPLHAFQIAEQAPDPYLPEEVTMPPTLLQLELNPLSGSLTITSLHQQNPAQNLLHNRYEILGQAGTGGFGAVYKARDKQNRDRMVAIKAIELDTLSAIQAIEATDTFNREVSLLSNLDNSHLPRIYEHFPDTTHWYLVMDFIAGETLDAYFEQLEETSLAEQEVIEIGLQLCEVLRYLHELQPPIIFRDVKPENVMRAPGGHLYLIDFGIARRFKPGQARDTTPLGSPGFAAPEQYGRTQTTVQSDIYGLGATLYFLLTHYDLASTPFHLPPLASLRPALSDTLLELITSMLALEPANRPASISVVQQCLRDCLFQLTHQQALMRQQAAMSVRLPTRSGWLNHFLKWIFPASTLLLMAFFHHKIVSNRERAITGPVSIFADVRPFVPREQPQLK